MKYGIYTLLIVGVLIGTIVLSYKFKSSWNYNWAYEARVQATSKEVFCEMVKPEYLKDPSQCD